MDDFDNRPNQLSPLARRAPTAPVTGHAPKARPNPAPMRLALGAGGLAAFSALMGAIVAPATPPVVATVTTPTDQPTTAAAGTPIAVQRPIQYVQLLPGQTAPPGATVVDPSGPLPTAIVVNVPAPAQPAAKAPARKTIVVKTTQSGKVIP